MSIGSHDRQVLVHILKHCDNVCKDVKYVCTLDNLRANEMAQRSLACSVIQIGELVYSDLSKEFKSCYTKQKWLSIAAMRHKLVHHYEEIDVVILWRTATENVPALRSYLMQLLEDGAESVRRNDCDSHVHGVELH